LEFCLPFILCYFYIILPYIIIIFIFILPDFYFYFYFILFLFVFYFYFIFILFLFYPHPLVLPAIPRQLGAVGKETAFYSHATGMLQAC
jgi:hypothetical protein